MKQFNILCAGALLLLASACEQDLPKFSDEECLLTFDYGDDLTTEEVTSAMGRVSYSFKLNAEEGQELDTVWLEVNTMGKLSTVDRPLALQQVMITGGDTLNAEPGKHYIAFDDPALASLYQVPANSATARIPIVVRLDPSLDAADVLLRITFKDNGYFKAGYPQFATYTLTISNRLTSAAWALVGLEYYLGAYGEQKHTLINSWVEEPWDDEYIESLFYEMFPGYLAPKDESYLNYLSGWFAGRLEEENAERLANGQDIWREANGNPVDFTPLAWGY